MELKGMGSGITDQDWMVRWDPSDPLEKKSLTWDRLVKRPAIQGVSEGGLLFPTPRF